MTNPSYDIAYEATRYGQTLQGEHFVEFVDIATIEHHIVRTARAIQSLNETLDHLGALHRGKLEAL